MLQVSPVRRPCCWCYCRANTRDQHCKSTPTANRLLLQTESQRTRFYEPSKTPPCEFRPHLTTQLANSSLAEWPEFRAANRRRWLRGRSRFQGSFSPDLYNDQASSTQGFTLDPLSGLQATSLGRVILSARANLKLLIFNLVNPRAKANC